MIHLFKNLVFHLYFFKFGTRTVILMHSQSRGVNEVSIELGQ